METDRRDSHVNISNAELTLECAPAPVLHHFIEITEVILSKLSEPDPTPRIKIDDEIRAQVRQTLLRVPFKYPRNNWRTLQETLSQHLPTILYFSYPNTIAASKIDQFAFCLKDTIKRAVLATPRKETSCPYANRWWNNDITILKKESHRLRNRFRRSRYEYDRPLWREKANEFSTAIKKAKDKTWKEFTTSPPSSIAQHDSTNPLEDCEVSQEMEPPTVFHEANTYVLTTMFIVHLERLIEQFPEQVRLEN